MIQIIKSQTIRVLVISYYLVFYITKIMLIEPINGKKLHVGIFATCSCW